MRVDRSGTLPTVKAPEEDITISGYFERAEPAGRRDGRLRPRRTHPPGG